MTTQVAGQAIRLWLLPPNGPTQRTAAELREALVARFAQGARISLTDSERARVTIREIRAASFIDADFGARICSAHSPPPSAPEPSRPPVSPPPLQLPPPPPPSVPPPPHATARVRVQLFDSFGDGWDGMKLVVNKLSGAAIEHSSGLSPGLSSTTASLSLPLGCYQLQMIYQGGEPLKSTSTLDTAEASWRLLDCPTGSSSSVHLAHEVAQACVTADASCALLEAPMLPPSPPLPDSPPLPLQPPREHPLPPALPPPPPSQSPASSVPTSPPFTPRAPIPSTPCGAAPPYLPPFAPPSPSESSPPLSPTAPPSSGPQTPPSPHVPEPSPPSPPTAPLPPVPPTGPTPQVLPYAPSDPPSPVVPLPPGPTLPPQLPTRARPPSAPTKRPRSETDVIGGVDTKIFVHRLFSGVFGFAFAVWLCRFCHDSRRQVRRAQAQDRRRAEHDAPINNSYVCSSFQVTAAQWLERGDRGAQPWQPSGAQQQNVGPQAEDATTLVRLLISSGVFSVDPPVTSEEHAERPMPLLGWNSMALSGPAPSLPSEAGTVDGRHEHQRFQIDANRFSSPPLAVLATGDARVATSEATRTSLRGCFMLHSVVHAVSAEMLRNVLLEAAELRKLDSHPSLLRLCAVVTDQPWGEVGLLSELTTGSLATLLETSPVQLTWSSGLLALATNVADGLAHLHGLEL